MIHRSDTELIIESLDEPALFGEIFDRHAETVFGSWPGGPVRTTRRT